MRIIIECDEYKIDNAGELYNFHIKTEAGDFFKVLADKVANEAVDKLKKGTLVQGKSSSKL